MRQLLIYLPFFVLTMVFLIKPFSLHAQKFTYTSVEKNTYVEDVNYFIGRDGNNVIIWLYNRRNHTLQATLYNSNMTVLTKSEFRFKGADEFLQLEFVRRNTNCDVIVQYSTGAKIITRFFSFDKSANAILPGKVLEESGLFAALIVKFSPDNNYTGLMKGYITTTDSLLVQYSLYDKKDNLLYNSSLILPRLGHDLYLQNGTVDNNGNFFFYDITTNPGSKSQTVNLYEVNVKKDSLITNEISQQGSFFSVHIRESSIVGEAVISGVLLQSSDSTIGFNTSANCYIFLQQLNENLTPQSGMMLIPSPLYAMPDYGSAILRNISFAESKDSSYLFYTNSFAYTGPLRKANNSRSYATGNYFPSVPGESRIAMQSERPFSLYTNALTDARYSYVTSPVSYPGYSTPDDSGPGFSLSELDAGNTFITTTVNGSKQVASHVFRDTTPASTPEYDFVAGTGKKLQYIYSRILKNRKQVIYYVEASSAEISKPHPLISKSNYRILINRGAQVSSDAVIFPYLNKRKIAFVKLNLE